MDESGRWIIFIHAAACGAAIRMCQSKTPTHLNLKEPNNMLSWAITFLVIALIAAVLGFGGLAGTAVGIAKILFFVFIVLFIISFFMGRRTPSP
jgi:uncharacterized membrane protein YtjA (UPF0391 family)